MINFFAVYGNNAMLLRKNSWKHELLKESVANYTKHHGKLRVKIHTVPFSTSINRGAFTVMVRKKLRYGGKSANVGPRNLGNKGE